MIILSAKSLTTPTFSEGINWHVFNAKIKISSAQVN
jgi:carbonic anhydrase